MKLALAIARRARACTAALALAPRRAAGGDLPAQSRGTSVGEGVPFKAYATIDADRPPLRRLVTAKLAVVADTKWVDPARLRVHTDFKPYGRRGSPQRPTSSASAASSR